jgi:DNA-binding LytR/AlgR family response regulator
VSSDQLTILAVDDEQTQVQDLARLLRKCHSVSSVECAFDGYDALAKATAHRYHAIFLDVRMPDLDGLALGRVLRRFEDAPQLVFVSAYDSAAVDAFELRALDYLLKPVSRRRVEETVARVAAAVESAGVANPQPSRHSSAESEGVMVAVSNVRTGATRLIARSEVLYVQSYGDFVRVVAEDGRYLLRATLAEIERRWEPFGFVRVHRQYVANLLRAVELRPLLGGTAELGFPGGQTIPVARRHTAALGRRLGV